MTSEEIAVIQVGPNLDFEIQTLPATLLDKFPDVNTTLLQPLENVHEAFNSKRKQYHSTRLIAMLESRIHQNQKIMGITSLDLYNPGMDGRGFIFGEARCPGHAGIVSTARLRTNVDERGTFEERVRKEVVHEIGHMIGLNHCTTAFCVMKRSTNMRDTDKKTDKFCEKCQTELRK